ncbi:MAG: nitroreductase [Myxococcales bacterium]|nr:nitroreductase [Myxococcales bacterium]
MDENVVIRLLQERYATRAIAVEPFAEEIVDELSEAIRLTPSCYNNQPWRFLFCLSEAGREKAIACLSAGNAKWAGRAPLLIIGYSAEADDCANPDGRKYHQFDLGMSVMSMLLAATTRRLVARPMAGFNPAKAKELFALPESAQPLVMIAVGYPSADEDHLPEYARDLARKPRLRKAAAEIVSRR